MTKTKKFKFFWSNFQFCTIQHSHEIGGNSLTLYLLWCSCLFHEKQCTLNNLSYNQVQQDSQVLKNMYNFLTLAVQQQQYIFFWGPNFCIYQSGLGFSKFEVRNHRENTIFFFALQYTLNLYLKIKFLFCFVFCLLLYYVCSDFLTII